MNTSHTVFCCSDIVYMFCMCTPVCGVALHPSNDANMQYAPPVSVMYIHTYVYTYIRTYVCMYMLLLHNVC